MVVQSTQKVINDVNENIEVTKELLERIQEISKKAGYLSKEDEDFLIMMSQKTAGMYGDDVMFLKHYSSIDKICAAFTFSHREKQEKGDYVNDCYESLKEAMQKYRFNEGVRFNTYLSIIIRRDLNDNWYKKNPCSKYYQQQYYLIEEYRNEYVKENGYEPSEAEICRALDYTPERLRKIQREAQKCFPVYLEEIAAKDDIDMLDNDGVTAVDEIYLDPALRVKSPEECIIEKETNMELHDLLTDLGPLKADILYRIAGVGKYIKAQSKAQIMRETGLSKQRLNNMLEQILPYAQNKLATVR